MDTYLKNNYSAREADAAEEPQNEHKRELVSAAANGMEQLFRKHGMLYRAAGKEDSEGVGIQPWACGLYVSGDAEHVARSLLFFDAFLKWRARQPDMNVAKPQVELYNHSKINFDTLKQVPKECFWSFPATANAPAEAHVFSIPPPGGAKVLKMTLQIGEEDHEEITPMCTGATYLINRKVPGFNGEWFTEDGEESSRGTGVFWMIKSEPINVNDERAQEQWMEMMTDFKHLPIFVTLPEDVESEAMTTFLEFVRGCPNLRFQ